jgi:acyl-coenzyme A synthetase/AMP-(fatty) acid ligase
LLTGGTLVMVDSFAPADVMHALVEHAVQRLSCTPTMIRQLLLAAPREAWDRCVLESVTLGGETSDQRTLDAVRAVLPRASLRHIYASTELGAILTVVDGQAGFPAELLDGTSLRVENDQLFARRRSDRAMRGYIGTATASDDWHATGDLVEVVGDRVYFVGRIDDVINVGGLKVRPFDVERVIRELPEVADVVVTAHPSSIAGNLVKAIVAARPDAASTIKAAIAQHCRARLPAHMIPRIIEVRDRLDVSVTQKRSVRP